jgi:hypothetical protein
MSPENRLAIVLSFLAAVSVACSVERHTVKNEPPTIKREVVSFENDFGTLKPESISLFLWPDGLSEEQAQNLVRTVKSASIEIDRLTIELRNMAVKKAELELNFQTLDCVKQWANLAPDADPELVDWVSKWKPLALDASNDQKEVRANCMRNQEERKSLAMSMDINASNAQPMAMGVIFKSLDPLYPDKQENFKSIGIKGSKVVIHPAGAVVTFADFLHEGNTQSTDLGTYDSKTKLLQFSFPEVSNDGKTTGAIFQFALERNPNFMDFARFAGDVKLVKDGKTLRYGSAQIDGRLR